MYAAPATSASVMPLSGEPLTENLPSRELDVLGRRLELVRRRSACALSATFVGRAGDRLAAHGQRARAVGARGRTGPVAGVAVDDLDLSGSMPEPVGDDLRERRSRGPGRAARCRCRRSPSRSACTRTIADSQKPACRPTPLGPTTRDGARPQISM